MMKSIMDSNNTNDSARTSKPGWTIIAPGDNGFDLVQYVIVVNNFAEAAQVAAQISSLITSQEQTDDVFNTQITLRRWRVEIQLALPSQSWGTPAQQKLTDAISELKL